jgi:alkylated DNA repair dioxygenase AlkB
MSKRTLDHFFAPKPKKSRVEEEATFGDVHDIEAENGLAISVTHSPKQEAPKTFSTHKTYPWNILDLPASTMPAKSDNNSAVKGKLINDQADLDILYFQPLFAKQLASILFQHLRTELFFYRVEYKIKRGALQTDIKTPRFTTVFGVDDSSRFDDSGMVVDAITAMPVQDRYKTCSPRPIPECLDTLRRYVEAITQTTYNFVLVNYYASGEDSISYHSDDEHFLGPLPTIASLSLGGTRDFCLKHKMPEYREKPPIKLPLESGDMVVMRGKTQSCWLHSIPKRKGKDNQAGRINITFRRAVIKAGTENYYK